MRQLADAGAEVVGLNCAWGPATMLPLLPSWSALCGCPSPRYRCRTGPTPSIRNFQALVDPGYAAFPAGQALPDRLDPFTCNRYEIVDFTRAALEAGVRYLGLCCGAAPHHMRAMAEALGRTPPASRYSEDMSRHIYFGYEPTLAAPQPRVRPHPVVARYSAFSLLRHGLSERRGRGHGASTTCAAATTS